jgi:hypothetical protein
VHCSPGQQAWSVAPHAPDIASAVPASGPLLEASSVLPLPESSFDESPFDASSEPIAPSLSDPSLLDASPELLLPDPLADPPPELLDPPLDASLLEPSSGLPPSGPLLDPSSWLPLAPSLDASLLDASSELPLLELDASAEPMPELLPDPLLPLPELPAPLLLDEKPELPLPERGLSPNVPSVEASAAEVETSPDLPPQPHTASATKSAAHGTISRRSVRRTLIR